MRTGDKPQVVKQQVEGSGHKGATIIGANECSGLRVLNDQSGQNLDESFAKPQLSGKTQMLFVL